MIIRPACENDLPALVDIYNDAVLNTVATFDLHPLTIEDRRSWLRQFGDDDPLLLCESDGRVLGYAFYLPYRQKPAYATSKEVTVYVDASHQRQGVASALYTALIAHARQRHVHVLIAVIAGDNPPSRALHVRFDFTEVGTLKQVGHKFGDWVDTTIYQRVLS